MCLWLSQILPSWIIVPIHASIFNLPSDAYKISPAKAQKYSTQNRTTEMELVMEIENEFIQIIIKEFGPWLRHLS
jgi:hypothetical protein